MDEVSWRRRFVHDMLFGIDGSGWHPAELRDAVGFRWSGPGHFSVLRASLPPGAGRGEAHVCLVDPEPLPDVAIFLNGHRLVVTPRRLGAMGVLDFAWDEAAMAGEPRAEFWFHVARLRQLPSPSQGMRGVGLRLSTLVLEPATTGGPVVAGEALALIAGQRFVVDRLPVSAGRARMAFLTDGGARMLDMRLEAARLGPTPQPHLACALRAEGEALEFALAAPGAPALRGAMTAAGDLRMPQRLAARDGLLFARLLGALPGAYAAWLDEAMAHAAPDAAMLAEWRRALARLGRAAEGWLAAAIADGPDPFAADPAMPFAWPQPD